MKFKIAAIVFAAILVLTAPLWWFISANWDEPDPDVPVNAKIDKEEYMRLRSEQLGMWRGLDTARQGSRSRAIRDMERGERTKASRAQMIGEEPEPSWRALGPAPIPVGANNSYSGRVSSIAVHPTNPDIVYVGAAQGGLYRSLNGGATWTPLLDDALSLAIGAVSIAPSDPTTVFVGTGEPAFSSDSFFGVGIYRITNADTNPVISGPLNLNNVGADVFTGRSVSEIIIHPTDPNILFAATTSGVAGTGASTAGLSLPNSGLFRTTNAMGASPVFEKLTIQGTTLPSRSVVDALIEPGNFNRLIIAVVGGSGDGGVYVSSNAMEAVPTFTRTLTTGDGSGLGRTELAGNKTGDIFTVYAASGTGEGTLFKSVDGANTFNAGNDNNFCRPQCFYDIAVAVDPGDAEKVYLGGSPTVVFQRSVNGGTNFTPNSQTASGLHVDTHAIAYAPSNPSIVYFGSDGGIWKTLDVNATPILWTTLNNSTISATQFQGLSLHPRDRNYLLGGTQDNGTQFLAPDGQTWIRSDGGDGGFSVIDKNSASPNSVTAYHTYFNQTNTQIGFSRATTTEASGDPFWTSLRGCQNGNSNNGIICTDNVLFYAPMVGGPGTPNSLYFGTIRLYRSIDTGTTMTDISGVLPARISAIAISPQNDNIRLVGLTNGNIFLSTTAEATTMTDITGPIPSRYVGRVAIDPSNSDVAYVALNGFGLSTGQHVWKTTNLLSSSPVWNPAGTGIPDVPVNAFEIDPADTNILFAGTDIGVFRSSDGGNSWEPFSSGLPRVAVFGMEFQPRFRVLRIATHGRGIYEYDFGRAKSRADFDADGRTDLSVFRGNEGNWYMLRSTEGFIGIQWGGAGDIAVPGDYDGDGRADTAVYRPGAQSAFYVLRSQGFVFASAVFGQTGDVPVAGDYDGDDRTDVAVFRPSVGGWYSLDSSTGIFRGVTWGQAGDVPVPADYDGDGRTDQAVRRGADWYLFQSTAGFSGISWGFASDRPVPADYDGDDLDDIAVFRENVGGWYILRSTSQSFLGITWGQVGDVPVPGDYDADGKDDQAVFRNGEWYMNQSTAGFAGAIWGSAGDIPVPARYIP